MSLPVGDSEDWVPAVQSVPLVLPTTRFPGKMVKIFHEMEAAHWKQPRIFTTPVSIVGMLITAETKITDYKRNLGQPKSEFQGSTSLGRKM